MSDLTLNINGNASGASAAFREAGGAVEGLGDDVGKSVVKWQELAAITKKAVEMVVKFGVDAVKAYAESERVQKQLTRAAGEYADVLGEQAEALSKKYAVDDDIIKQSQVLLTQWGGVGAATEDVTKAVLNYAAATGQDAVSATSDLIRNVESGGVGLAKMGVHFTATGRKGKDLAAAVEALQKKFGGAAGADAQSLHGAMAGVSLAMEDLQKSVGSQISRFLAWSGAVGATEKALRGLQATVEGKGFEEERVAQQIQKEKYLATMRAQLREQTERLIASEKVLPTLAGPAAEAWSNGLATLREEIAATQTQIDAFITGSVKSGDAGAALPGVTGLTNKALKATTQPGRTDDERLADAKKFYDDLDSIEEHAAEQEAQLLASREKQRAAFVTGLEKSSDEAWKAIDKQEQAALEKAKKRDEEKGRQLEKSEKDSLERSKQQADKARQAGDAIGAAFVNALGEQLSKLAEGGEFDVALFVGDILAAAVSIAATVIGTAYGMPALGAAAGNLFATGIRAGSSALSVNAKKARTTKQYHAGGWVGDEAELPRYHSGAWIGSDEQRAILQTGERVLSRQEVHHMGGPRGVDAAARGSGGVVVNIQAIDSKSAAEAFERDLAEGMRKAQLTGRGMLPALLGAGPR